MTRTAPVGLRLFTTAESFALVGAQGVGRVDVTRHALHAPVALPYVVEGDELVLSTLGTGLGEVLDGAVVTFEVDGNEPRDGGWRVVLVGPAQTVDQLVRIRPTDVTGYRLPTPRHR